MQRPIGFALFCDAFIVELTQLTNKLFGKKVNFAAQIVVSAVLACSTEVAQTEPSDRLIKATRADRSPKKSLVAKAVPVVFSGGRKGRSGLTGARIDAQIVFGRNGQSFIGRLRRVQPVGAYLRRLLHRTVRQYE